MSTQQSFFHLAGQPLGPGSTILPGNWGRVIRRWGWAHTFAIREMALETYRLVHHPELPSRMEAAFIFLTVEEANFLKVGDGSQRTGFEQHCLYRVRLATPDAPSFVADYRFVAPAGALRHDWAELYWRGLDGDGNVRFREGDTAVNVPADGRGPYREMLTLSPLVIEERLDQD